MKKPGAAYCEEIHEWLRSLNGDRLPIRIMEVCGTHTMSIARAGLRSLLPDGLRLISGPGCPVCVTDQSYMDLSIALARGQAGPENAIIATYGDMVRVPGRGGSLAEARADGADVRVVYGADQAVDAARDNPGREVIFLAVGFETTTPGTALALRRARDEGIDNFSALTAHKLILPAMEALLSDEECRIDAFLCPGHVSVILGYEAYADLAKRFAKPCVVAGFDAEQVLAGVAAIVEQLAAGRAEAASTYPAATAEGNAVARDVIDRTFESSTARWRALGEIPGSGLDLRDEWAGFDAMKRFELAEPPGVELPGCRCGEVISGRCEPAACGWFGERCTPRCLVGPCMVSSEGACAAAYKYGRPAMRAS